MTVPIGWYCACGHPNGINLGECACCTRRPGGPENPIEVIYMPSDMIRINKVENGFVISSRKEGTAPRTYSYDDRAVATNVDEVCRQVRALLDGSMEKARALQSPSADAKK